MNSPVPVFIFRLIYKRSFGTLYCMDILHYRKLLYGFYQAKKRMPSYREAAELFRVRSKESAFTIIKKLIKDGIVSKDTMGKLIPAKSHTQGIRVLGLVEAGFPTPAEEDILDTVSFDEWLIENKEASFMLRVKGDSMVDAGIFEGDMVVVERTDTFRPGEIVIAEVDGAFTMKYLRKDRQGFYLDPANDSYKPIRPKEALSIKAVVRAVVRKYER